MIPLSKSIYLQAPGSERMPDSISVEDVKVKIKELKEILRETEGVEFECWEYRIDELFGAELI